MVFYGSEGNWILKGIGELAWQQFLFPLFCFLLFLINLVSYPQSTYCYGLKEFLVIVLILYLHVSVDIPPWFSAVSLALNSDVDLVSNVSIILSRSGHFRIAFYIDVFWLWKFGSLRLYCSHIFLCRYYFCVILPRLVYQLVLTIQCLINS